MPSYVPSFSFTNPVYKPAMRVIAGITQAPQCTVTTTVPHGYIVFIPDDFNNLVRIYRSS